MFEHLIYTLAALLLVIAAPTPPPDFDPVSSVLPAAAILVLYFLVTSIQSRIVLDRHGFGNRSRLERSLPRLQRFHGVLAVLAIGVLTQFLHLPALLSPDWVIRVLPTAAQLLCLGVFAFLMFLSWVATYPIFRRIFTTRVTRREYVTTQLAMSLPALLPWMVLSGCHDLLLLVPLPGFQSFLSSLVGEQVYYFVMLAFVVVLAPLGIRKFWGCKSLPDSQTRRRIEALCATTGTRYRDILLWSAFGGRMLTAGVMGAIGRFRFILVTPALLDALTPDELDAVVLHEIGHVKKGHLILYVLVLVGLILVLNVNFDLIQLTVLGSSITTALFQALPFGNDTLTLIAGLAALILMLAGFIRYVFAWFMRNFERQADAFAFSSQGESRHLIHTFRKIARYTGVDPERPNWHHFGISERIRFLEACEQTPGLPKRQDRKVWTVLLVYGLTIGSLAGFGYAIQAGQIGEPFVRDLAVRALQQQAISHPDEPNILRNLGDIYQESDREREAAEVYSQALALAPEDPELLNNMAWLHIKAETPGVHDPELGVYLAEKAVRIESHPHFIDTLAEGYHTLGRQEEAVRAGELALIQARKQGVPLKYYVDQLNRFKAANSRF